jgi:hypothetical protein
MDHREFWFDPRLDTDSLSSPQRQNRLGDHEDFYIMDIGCYSAVIKRLDRKDDHSLGSPNEDVCVDLYLYSSIRPHNVELKLHNTTKQSATQHNTVQHNTTQCNTTQRNTTQCNTTHYILVLWWLICL